jgi:hypothetical protein
LSNQFAVLFNFFRDDAIPDGYTGSGYSKVEAQGNAAFPRHFPAKKKRDISRKISFYQPRHPTASGYYRCVQDHFELLEMSWSDYYESRYGFWRPYVLNVIHRYLDCGDFHCGFARVPCDQCGHEYLLAFSCKRRHVCPSCHQKRVVAFNTMTLFQ